MYNNFVFVNAPTKKKTLQVVGIIEVNEHEVEYNFLKNCKGEKGFIFSDKDVKNHIFVKIFV